MPCDSIMTVTLDLKNANIDIVKKALEGKGYQNITQSGDALYWLGGSFIKKTGQITSSYDDMAWFQQAYATELVKRKIRKFGWQVKQAKENKFVVTKR